MSESQQERLARKIAALQVKVDADKVKLAARHGSEDFRWGNSKLPDGSTEPVTKPKPDDMCCVMAHSDVIVTAQPMSPLTREEVATAILKASEAVRAQVYGKCLAAGLMAPVGKHE